MLRASTSTLTVVTYWQTWLMLSVVGSPLLPVQVSFCPEVCTCQQETDHLYTSCIHIDDLTTIPDGIPHQTHQLFIEYTSVSYIGRELEHLENMTVLGMSHNKLLDIDSNAFQGLYSLQTIDMSHNKLHGDPLIGRFKHLSSLQRLNLANNEIHEIRQKPFQDLHQLIELDLSGNKLKHMHADGCQGLSSLLFLKLDQNDLQQLPALCFQELDSLLSLHLSSNNVNRLHSGVFHSLDSLITLNLDNSGVETIDMHAFAQLTKLELLILSNNNLSSISGRSLRHLSNLRQLYLDANPIVQLASYSLFALDNLETVYMRQMPVLQRVQTAAFSDLPALRVVNLDKCKYLSEIQDGAFQNTPELRIVELKNNVLETLSVGALPWHHIQRVSLRGNPWLCDCRMSWLTEHTEIISRLGGDPVCAAPGNLIGIPLMRVSNFTCQSEDEEVHSAGDTWSFKMLAQIHILLPVLGGCATVAALVTGLCIWNTRKKKWQGNNNNYAFYKQRQLSSKMSNFSNSSDQTTYLKIGT